MSQVILRGDAPESAKVVEVYFKDFGDQDLAIATITGTSKQIRYRATVPSDAASGMATLINASSIPEFQEISASASGSILTLTAKTKGKPFYVTFSTGESSATNISIVETTKGVAPTNEVQKILISGSPTGGTWTYTNNFGSGDETTAGIAHDATAADVQAAIEGLASVSSGDLSVTGTQAGGYFVTWKGTYAASEVSEGTIDTSSLTGGTASHTLTETARGRSLSDEVVVYSLIPGSTTYSYKLNFGGQATSLLDQDDTASTIQAALEALSTIGAGNVSVSLSERPDGNGGQLVVIHFQGDLAETNVGSVTVSDRTNITPSGSTIAVAQAGGAATQDAIQFVNLDTWTPNGSEDITLGLDGDETVPFNGTDINTTIESAIEGLTGVSDVEINGGNSAITNPNGFLVRFKGTQADSAVSLMTIDSSALTSPGSPSVTEIVPGDATVNQKYELYLQSSSGTFTIGDGTDTTSAINWNASAATIKTRLETDIGSITTASVSGSGTEAEPWVIEITSPANTALETLTVDDALLGGTSGVVTEVTEHNAGTNEVMTITIDAGVTGGTWGGVADGVPLGPFAHDEAASVIEDELQAIYGVGNVTCTGSAGGPYTITFLGDLAEQDIDAITVDGNNLESGPGDESITVTLVSRSKGPNHANDPANWVGGRVPETGDDLLIEDGTAALLYGLNWLTTFTADADSDRITIESCDFADEQKVRVKSSGTLPAGLSSGTDYYVNLINDNEIQLSTTRGGSAVNITDAGTGTHTIQVELLSYTKSSVHTGEIGLPKRNTDGELYYEYRNRAFRFAVLSSGDKKITVGAGEGAGSGRHIIHTGDSEIDMVIYKTGGSNEPGVPAFQHTGQNSNSLVIVHEAECGFAFDAGSLSEYRKITQHGGIVTLGQGQTMAEYLKTDGEFLADQASFTGTLTIVG